MDKINKQYIGAMCIIGILLLSIYYTGRLVEIPTVIQSESDWSYEGNIGPMHWSMLNPNYRLCGKGKQQSPIDIDTHEAKVTKGGGWEIYYEPVLFSVQNNGHTINVIPESTSNYVVVEGEKYEFKGFHFHTQSEHLLNGQSFPLEVHFVHQKQDGAIAVLGVFIKEGAVNKELEAMWKALPKETGESFMQIKSLNMRNVLPDNPQYFSYNGSLTTPPCTEGVQWAVLHQPIELSREQILAYRAVFPDNHRPVQPPNKREIVNNKLYTYK
ncbi:carbonic anhydrase family protein [Ectobacillus sp. JY-23]|uniref:carbonic anhydrase n=1 Tax=Ectobacillus sp. JY-23 TaxID=2933872 RepID=UPI001FF36137|nr:carbonic anhydrase family protein [Ectobacillus sp. JY-23]UOY93087.1 carbonic anhydrase family protein [Ectobacillus sp. JY-23]